jgi:hypothetical protein
MSLDHAIYFEYLKKSFGANKKILCVKNKTLGYKNHALAGFEPKSSVLKAP